MNASAKELTRMLACNETELTERGRMDRTEDETTEFEAVASARFGRCQDNKNRDLAQTISCSENSTTCVHNGEASDASKRQP